VRVACAGNHGHVLTIAAADLDSTVDKVYDIRGTTGHTHSVTLTVANLRLLKAGTAVAVTSSSEPGHSHQIQAACSQTADIIWLRSRTSRTSTWRWMR
jgi:hypothetical protein